MNKSPRLFAFLLAILLSFNAFPVVVFADSTARNEIVVIACSDFQDPSKTDAGSASNVTAILKHIAVDHPTIDGVLFCGDLDYRFPTKDVQQSLSALKGAFTSFYGSDYDLFVVQGNHDNTAVMETGVYDTADYGVYLINEDDYSWQRYNTQAQVEATAAGLEAYLNEKAAANYSKPIFVITHVPLHYSNRTKSSADGRFARILFDVLNKAGEAGLNVTFLYGHDHNNGYDNYLGGAAVYLPADEYPDGTPSTICIAKTGSASLWTTEPLHFAYMNAGFTGYYTTSADDADDTLTMTVFTITDNGMKIERYDANGRHNLKSAGSDREDGNFNTDVINTQVLSDYFVERRDASAVELADDVTGVRVSARGLTDLTVTSLTADDTLLGTIDSNGSYTYVNIDADGIEADSRISVRIPVGSLADNLRLVYVGDGYVQKLTPYFRKGYAVFYPPALGSFILTEAETADWTFVPDADNRIYTTDTVVIDYGKPVSIDILTRNIMLDESGELTGLAPAAVMPDGSFRTDEMASGFARTLTTASGTYSIENNRVTYTPASMSMTDAETVAVCVHLDGSADDPRTGFYYSTLTVVPATAIYYEETFLQLSGEWVHETTGTPAALQAEDRPGTGITPEGCDADGVYGYDAGYAGCAADPSNALQYVTTVTKGMTNPPSASFTFTGTGFDIISVTDKQQGFVVVEVYGEDGELVSYETYDEYYGTYEAPASWGVDCYYGYKTMETVGFIKYMCCYTDAWHAETEIVTGKSLNEGEIEVDALPNVGEAGKTYVMYETAYDWTGADENVTLYQIPILKSRDALQYGTYTVVITPTYTEFFDHVKDDTSYNFAIDAVRIYDPAGVHDVGFDPDNGLDNVNRYYLKDNEAWPQFIVLHSAIVNQDEFSASSDVNGAVFLDAVGLAGTVSHYTNIGPNNEVYLAPGQSVAFGLNASSTDIAAVHIAAKAVNGAVSYTVNGAEKTAVSATDLYTDVTKQVKWNGTFSDVIVITNTSSDGSILALTNLKITFNTMPDEAVSLNLSGEIVAAALELIETYKLNSLIEKPDEPGAEAEPDLNELFAWVGGRQLAADKKAVGKAPSVTKNDKFASSGVIPYVEGKTDVVNIAKFDNKTAATVLWLNVKGAVIGVTESFDAGKDVNVNNLKVKFGTKDGAVSYRLTVSLTNKAKDGPTAFLTVSAGSVLFGSAD